MSVGKKPTIYDTFSSYEIEPGVRCSSFCKDGKLVSLPLAAGAKTAWESFNRGVGVSKDDRCLGWRSGDGYAWWTYDDVMQNVRRLAAALRSRTPLQRQQFVGIYSVGCPNWIVTALAAMSRSLVVVPLYDTLGPESRSYIINEVEMSILFCDSAVSIGRVLAEAKSTPSLRMIVSFEEALKDDLKETARKANIELVSLKEFTADHGAEPEDLQSNSLFDPPSADDLFMIMYTSGTTGNPKGVMHKHQAIVANFASFDLMFRGDVCEEFKFTKNDVCLLYLPLAHAYAQLIIVWFLYHGASIGFHSGNILKLVEDAAALKPTYMPLVPRLMNRLYSKVTATVAESKTKSAIFWFCYKRKKALLQRGIITRSTIWDKLAFKRLQNLLGGKVWLMSVGSAPIAPEVLEFWRICFGAPILEGYGQTECTAAATFAFDAAGGNVGHPVSCNYLKLADAPECGYFVRDGRGEVCVKGPNVMVGYYKQPEKTTEAIDADGWLHTGDIGEFNRQTGALRLIDRKKHIFKLSQGEYIAPEKIESVYAMCPLVAQVFVDGSSLESYTVAIVVPEQAAATEWATKNGVSEASLSTNKEFAKHLLQTMLDTGKTNRLNSLEQVKAIHVASESFSPDNGLLTPTLKNKRPELRKFFQTQIDALYKAGPLIEPQQQQEQKAANNNHA